MRYIEASVRSDLTKKMVFVGGPRQCGKTTLAKRILADIGGRYFTWDLDEDRNAILKKDWSESEPLLVFDELHKFFRWKNWIKGIFDTQHEQHQLLVTGSARLDVFRRGGDSLLGRYHYWRLHPFTLDERPAKMGVGEAFARLLSMGGFPEPFLTNDARFAKRWRRDREDRVLRDDLRDLEHVREISAITLLVASLRQRVGGLVVVGNIAQDLQVSPNSVKHWITLLERMYLVFVVPPFTQGVPRAIQKPPKVYFFDNGDIEGDEGARFENLVATHLLKWLHWLEDHEGDRWALHYLRDKEGREVDFAITKNRTLVALVEAKLTDAEPSKSLKYYAERLRPKLAIQIVADVKKSTKKLGIAIEGINALTQNFLAAL